MSKIYSKKAQEFLDTLPESSREAIAKRPEAIVRLMAAQQVSRTQTDPGRITREAAVRKELYEDSVRADHEESPQETPTDVPLEGPAEEPTPVSETSESWIHYPETPPSVELLGEAAGHASTLGRGLAGTGMDIARSVGRGIQRGSVRGTNLLYGAVARLTGMYTDASLLDEDYIMETQAVFDEPYARGAGGWGEFSTNFIESATPRVATIIGLAKALPVVASGVAIGHLGTTAAKAEPLVNSLLGFLGSSKAVKYLTLGGLPQPISGRPEQHGELARQAVDFGAYVGLSLGALDEEGAERLAEDFADHVENLGPAGRLAMAAAEDLSFTVALDTAKVISAPVATKFREGLKNFFKTCVEKSRDLVRGLSSNYQAEVSAIRSQMEGVIRSAPSTDTLARHMPTRVAADIRRLPAPPSAEPRLGLPAPPEIAIRLPDETSGATIRLPGPGVSLADTQADLANDLAHTSKVALAQRHYIRSITQDLKQAQRETATPVVARKTPAKGLPKARVTVEGVDSKIAPSVSPENLDKSAPIVSAVLDGSKKMRSKNLENLVRAKGSFLDADGRSVISQSHDAMRSSEYAGGLTMKRTIAGNANRVDFVFPDSKTQTLAELFIKTDSPDPVLKQMTLDAYGMTEAQARAHINPYRETLVDLGILKPTKRGLTFGDSANPSTVYRFSEGGTKVVDTGVRRSTTLSSSMQKAIEKSKTQKPAVTTGTKPKRKIIQMKKGRSGQVDPQVFMELGVWTASNPLAVGACMGLAHAVIPGIEFEPKHYAYAMGASMMLRMGREFVNNSLGVLDTKTMKLVTQAAAASLELTANTIAGMPEQAATMLRDSFKVEHLTGATNAMLRDYGTPTAAALSSVDNAVHYCRRQIVAHTADILSKTPDVATPADYAMRMQELGVDWRGLGVDVSTPASKRAALRVVDELLEEVKSGFTNASTPGDILNATARAQLLSKTLRDPSSALGNPSSLNAGVEYGALMRVVNSVAGKDSGTAAWRDKQRAAVNLAAMVQTLGDSNNDRLVLDFVDGIDSQMAFDDVANKIRYFGLLSNPNLIGQTAFGHATHTAHNLAVKGTTNVALKLAGLLDADSSQAAMPSGAFANGFFGGSIGGLRAGIAESVDLAMESVRLGRNIMDPGSKSFHLRFMDNTRSIGEMAGLGDIEGGGRALVDYVTSLFGVNHLDAMRASEVFWQSMNARGFKEEALTRKAVDMVRRGDHPNITLARAAVEDSPELMRQVDSEVLSASRAMVFKEAAPLSGDKFTSMSGPSSLMTKAGEFALGANSNGWVSKILNPIFATGFRANHNSWRLSPLGAVADAINYVWKTKGISTRDTLNDREVAARLGACVAVGGMMCNALGNVFNALGVRYVSRFHNVDQVEKNLDVRGGSFVGSDGSVYSTVRTGTANIMAASADAMAITMGLMTAPDEVMERLDFDSRSKVGALLAAFGTAMSSIDAIGFGETLRNATAQYRGVTGVDEGAGFSLIENIFTNVYSQMTPVVLRPLIEAYRGVQTIRPESLREVVDINSRLPRFSLTGPLEPMDGPSTPLGHATENVVAHKVGQMPDRGSLEDLLARANFATRHIANFTPTVKGKSMSEDRKVLWAYRSARANFFREHESDFTAVLTQAADRSQYEFEELARKVIQASHAHALKAEGVLTWYLEATREGQADDLERAQRPADHHPNLTTDQRRLVDTATQIPRRN